MPIPNFETTNTETGQPLPRPASTTGNAGSSDLIAAQMTDLKPCPFCGNDGSDPSTPLQVQPGALTDYVCCAQCGVFGPDSDPDKNLSAAKAWNQRAQQPLAAALRAAVQDLTVYADISVSRTAQVVLVEDILAAIAELEGAG